MTPNLSAAQMECLIALSNGRTVRTVAGVTRIAGRKIVRVQTMRSLHARLLIVCPGVRDPYVWYLTALGRRAVANRGEIHGGSGPPQFTRR